MRSFHVGERPLTRLPQAGFIDIDAPGDSRGTGAAVPPPCGSAAIRYRSCELIQGPFIRKRDASKDLSGQTSQCLRSLQVNSMHMTSRRVNLERLPGQAPLYGKTRLRPARRRLFHFFLPSPVSERERAADERRRTRLTDRVAFSASWERYNYQQAPSMSMREYEAVTLQTRESCVAASEVIKSSTVKYRRESNPSPLAQRLVNKIFAARRSPSTVPMTHPSSEESKSSCC
ncbi:hypothetical protein F2P81_004173 [Scophthalmus maximus]|uniref:Uncharacterized protein n=1 Tax=Scophthalmus maximus TaxID=52904 RepID=A0A6A4T5H9_SCOMX|nr:hypothetical protein F2P81_004173 [Scophthalmus maximus]